jgi:hypothetical protein
MQITQALSSLATGFELANMPGMVNAGGGAGLAGGGLNEPQPYPGIGETRRNSLSRVGEGEG